MIPVQSRPWRNARQRDASRWRCAADGAAGERLDRALARALAGPADPLSRSRLKSLIEEGRVSSGERPYPTPPRGSNPVRNSASNCPEARDATPRAQAIALTIVYEDEDLIVIDKPAGMVVHPAPGNPDGTLVNALIAHCGASLSGIGGVRRPGIVHRLDKDTSGLMVAAKTDAAHHALAAEFAARTRSSAPTAPWSGACRTRARARSPARSAATRSTARRWRW